MISIAMMDDGIGYLDIGGDWFYIGCRDSGIL
jgi:hypothetical protein